MLCDYKFVSNLLSPSATREKQIFTSGKSLLAQQEAFQLNGDFNFDQVSNIV